MPIYYNFIKIIPSRFFFNWHYSAMVIIFRAVSSYGVYIVCIWYWKHGLFQLRSVKEQRMFFVKLDHYRVMLMVIFLQVIKLSSSLITDWNKDFNSWTCHLGSKVIRKFYWNNSISYSFRLYMKKILFKKSQNQAEFCCCLSWFSFLSNVFTIFIVKQDSQFGSQNDCLNVQVRSFSSAQTPLLRLLWSLPFSSD